MANSVLLTETRSYRPFKSSEEYLYAMREDLAEWLNTLYPELRINVENFMDRLDTGVALCKHANNVRFAAEEYLARRHARNKSMTKSMTSGLAGPILAMGNIHFLPAAKSGTFFARDNVSNFIAWCRKSLQIFECLLFETDDLIMRKNEKHVILCLLEVARRGAKFGMLAPMLIQMERQIDREIAADNKAMGVSVGTETDKQSVSIGTDSMDMFESDSEDEDTAAEPMLVYGPQPQIITNDLKSLDEMVRDLVEKCTCPSQFPMIRVSEGKYRIGDTKVLIFVRILRSHVMVRVGGGWDTLSHYLDKHDPCRCRAQHRSSVAARLITKTNTTTNGIELHKAQVFYDRSPPISRKPMANINSPVHNNSNSSTLPLPSRSSQGSRSPTPQRRLLIAADSVDNGKRSASPKPQQKKKLQLNEPIMNSLLTTTNVAEELHPECVPVQPVLQNHGFSQADVKFENISDNGSEISDEGYRSLGLIQNGQQATTQHDKRHNGQQLSEDADFSARLDREPSNDSQLTSSSDNTPTQASSSKAMDSFEDLGPSAFLAENNANTATTTTYKNENDLDIASATGLRKTDFSALYDTKKKSKIPRSPLPAIRSRQNSVENLHTAAVPARGESLSKDLPVRQSPYYSSVRRTISKPVITTKNTWNGRDNNPTVEPYRYNSPKRPTLTKNTFQKPGQQPSSNSRPQKSQDGLQYDANGRRIKPQAVSLNTSPVKTNSNVSSPLAQQILAAAENAQNDNQIIDAMKQLLRQYSDKSPEFDDFTTAWVNGNGSLDRTNSSTASPTNSNFTTKRAISNLSSNDSCHSKDGVSSRRSSSRIPAPVRHNTELY